MLGEIQWAWRWYTVRCSTSARDDRDDLHAGRADADDGGPLAREVHLAASERCERTRRDNSPGPSTSGYFGRLRWPAPVMTAAARTVRVVWSADEKIVSSQTCSASSHSIRVTSELKCR